MQAQDYEYMARALRLAARGLYTTHPNPRVGCVLVNNGEVVGEGWHVRAGEGHAEVNALAMAGVRARGATAYVTLEPCAHHGRTPPCSDALIKAGVTRVVSAMTDPNPLVGGQGLERIRAAGIEAVNGLLQAQAEQLNPGYLMRMRSGRPLVRSKLAMSLDGRTAMASGESKWVTSEAARQDVQRLRARSAAILTGMGTVRADDPALTLRLDGECAQPLRVVLDARLETPAGARLLDGPGKTLIFTASDDAARAEPLRLTGATIARLPATAEGVDPAAALRYLAEQQVNEVLVEAGARLNGALLRAGLIDELIIYVAPKLMGDAARGLFHLPGLERMAEAVELEIADIRAVGRDWRITAQIKVKS